MAKVPEQVVRVAWVYMLGGMTAWQAISRALSEHGNRYGHPADNARTILELGVMLGALAEIPVIKPPAPPASAWVPQPIGEWNLRPPPGQDHGDVRPPIAKVLERPTQTAGRSSAPLSGRCADPACKHGRGTHLRRGHGMGIFRQVSEPCLWGDCPCENYRGSGTPAPQGGPAITARIVSRHTVPPTEPQLAPPQHPDNRPPVTTPRVTTRVRPRVERPPVTIRYSLDSAPRRAV